MKQLLMKYWIHRLGVEILSVIFILLFLYTASSKLFAHQKFSIQLSQSTLLEPVATFLSYFIPSIEIVIAVLLAVPLLRPAGFMAAYSLMLCFTGYIAILLVSQSELPCSCGGILERLSWRAHLIVNVILTSLALAAICIQWPNRTDSKKFIAIIQGFRKPVRE
jgi:uncharacterized membrane protein YphA (DoxX/SURF4 family)